MSQYANESTGRTPTITIDDILAAGRRLGLAGLSMQAVAKDLGVTSAALYRHVGSRWGLERLVGESIIAEFDPHDSDAHDAREYLLSFALQHWDFLSLHPGLAEYLRILSPRGDEGRRVHAKVVAALVRRGFDASVSLIVSSEVALHVSALAATETARAALPEGFGGELSDVERGLAEDAALGDAWQRLPRVETREYVALSTTALVRGLLSFAKPGVPLDEVMAEVDAYRRGENA